MKALSLFLIASSSAFLLTSCPGIGDPNSDPLGGVKVISDQIAQSMGTSLIASEKAQIAKDTKRISDAIAALEKEGATFKQIEGLASADLSQGKALYGVALSDLTTLRGHLVADVRNSGAKSYSSSTKSATGAFQKSTNDFLHFAKSKNEKERGVFGFLNVSMGLFNKLTALYSSFQNEKREAMVREIEARLSMKSFDQL